MSPATLHLACAADARYLPYCLTMLQSVFEHAGGHRVHVQYLCAPEFGADARQAVAALVRARGHAVDFLAVPDEQVAGLPPMRAVRRLNWYRLFLPELLPHADRVLYLDADTLVVDSIGPLWSTDLRGHLLAAVPNVLDGATRARLLPALGLPLAARYFNSGVLLMDLRAMRAARFTGRVLDFARRHAGALVWADQDALNGVLAESYAPLHPRWNCMNSLFHFSEARDVFGPEALAEALRAPAILHFEGPDDVKPWHVDSTHPLRRRYRRALSRAAWRLPLPWWRRLLKSAWHASPDALRRLVARARNAPRRP